MGFLSPSQPQAPPPPPPPPPAANPPTYANPGVQAAGSAAMKRSAAAAGGLPGVFGADGTILTSPQGTGSGPTAAKQLTGQ